MNPDPLALLRSRSYVKLLVLAALIGVPVSAVAYGFLKLVDWLQETLFTDLPEALGFDTPPTWWPLPLLALSGLLVALAISPLPGTGGHSPADGFKPAGALPLAELPGVFLAALATLSFGVVLGPEAPLIAIGSGLGVLAVRLAARDAPDQAAAVIAAAGSFAAISSLLGSPLLGAFLLLEASGLGGPMLGVVLVPGLLAAGVGTLIFIGLDELTGFGTFSLALPGLPPFDRPTLAMFGWAIAFGLVAPFVGRGIQLLALAVRPHVERRMVLLMPVLGLLIAGLAIGFAEATDHWHPRSCSPDRTRSRRWSAAPRTGPSAPCCCSSRARAWRTRSRSRASAAGPCSRPCSSAPRAAWQRRASPAWSSCRRWRWGSGPCAP